MVCKTAAGCRRAVTTLQGSRFRADSLCPPRQGETPAETPAAGGSQPSRATAPALGQGSGHSSLHPASEQRSRGAPANRADFITTQMTREERGITRSLGQELPERLTPARGCGAAMQPHGSTPPRMGVSVPARPPRTPILFSFLARPSHPAWGVQHGEPGSPRRPPPTSQRHAAEREPAVVSRKPKPRLLETSGFHSAGNLVSSGTNASRVQPA